MESFDLHLKDAEEIEAFYLQTTGMRPDYLQLSSGAAGIQMHVVDLAGVTLVWATVQGKSRWRDQITGNGLHFGFAWTSQGPVRVQGTELTGHEAQVWLPGQQMEYMLDGPVFSLEISVDQELLELLGWQPRGEPTQNVGRHRLGRLMQLCRSAESNHGLPGVVIRDRILEEMESLLQPWISHPVHDHVTVRPDRNFTLFKATERYFRTMEPDEKLNVEEMARRLGFSRRTVFHAYREMLGIGPRRYLELIRLQELRQRLLSASPETTTVTKEATSLGFFHPGRLPRIYRRQYGENPVDTLGKA